MGSRNKGTLDLIISEFSLFLSWKVGFAEWYLGQSEGLRGTTVAFLDRSFSKGSLAMWSCRNHQCWSG